MRTGTNVKAYGVLDDINFLMWSFIPDYIRIEAIEYTWDEIDNSLFREINRKARDYVYFDPFHFVMSTSSTATVNNSYNLMETASPRHKDIMHVRPETNNSVRWWD